MFYFRLVLIFQILILKSLQQISPSNPVNNLILLPSAAKARCLDGTPAGFYYLPGNGNGLNKFYIYLEGGGSCFSGTLQSSIESCYIRSKSIFGSSSSWLKYYTNSGSFNDSPDLNPLFYNWNKVYVKYCDGNVYQGSASPYPYKDTSLYFRGSDNMIEVIQYLIVNQNLQNAETIVFSGGDSGGQAVLFWNQYFRSILPFNNLFIVPDSAIFPTQNMIQNNEFARYMDLITNNQRGILQPQGCIFLFTDVDVQKCQTPIYILDLVVVPTFFIQSLIDSQSLQNSMAIRCLQQNSLLRCNQQEMQKVNQLNTELANLLFRIIQAKQDWGVWAITCIFHVFSNVNTAFNNPNFSVPQNTGMTVTQALRQYIQPKITDVVRSNIHIDQVLYPNNSACS